MPGSHVKLRRAWWVPSDQRGSRGLRVHRVSKSINSQTARYAYGAWKVQRRDGARQRRSDGNMKDRLTAMGMQLARRNEVFRGRSSLGSRAHWALQVQLRLRPVLSEALYFCPARLIAYARIECQLLA